MRASSRTQLPTRLPDYAPGRILAVGPDEWTLPDVLEPSGVLIELPRYALDLRTLPVPIDPARVRRLLDGSAVRPLETRPVELSLHRGSLHVVAAHHELAAHLAVGAERIPVALQRAARQLA
jgi:hypothetical protein